MAEAKKELNESVRSILLQSGKYENPMQVPRLVKIVINRGVGEAREDSKAIDVSAKELGEIAGQKPLVIKARKAIAAFKLRGGLPIGLKVTLRGKRMYDFASKLVNICLPKIRDFKGVNPKSFDGRGNYAMGIKEHIVFPEIDFDKIDEAWGLDIVIATTAKTDAEAKALLKLFNMPFNS